MVRKVVIIVIDILNDGKSVNTSRTAVRKLKIRECLLPYLSTGVTTIQPYNTQVTVAVREPRQD